MRTSQFAGDLSHQQLHRRSLPLLAPPLALAEASEIFAERFRTLRELVSCHRFAIVFRSVPLGRLWRPTVRFLSQVASLSAWPGHSLAPVQHSDQRHVSRLSYSPQHASPDSLRPTTLLLLLRKSGHWGELVEASRRALRYPSVSPAVAASSSYRFEKAPSIPNLNS
jgi:hypothetical protein